MVQTNLLFFGTKADSRLGMFRGGTAFVPILVVLLAMSETLDWYTIVPALLLSLVLCSAVGVQFPSSTSEAALYGALVGFVVMVAAASVTYASMGTLHNVPTYVYWLPVLLAATSVITYHVSSHFHWYTVDHYSNASIQIM